MNLINMIRETLTHTPWWVYIVFLSYFVLMLFGVGGGWMLVRRIDLKFDHNRGLIQLPGTWITFLLIMTIFTMKYYFGYSLTTDPTLADNTNFELLMLSVSGICTGLFIGRLGGYLIKKGNASHSNLQTYTQK